ncbi:Hypothetical protein SRAE_2000326200 [Strongyloides ratti]|uniref:Uncharacterized protein n=1 Tax=Strongyloides ratti TaxID=34506 RepID=A0A090LFN8_STRRB|nr:Hypothetical protein SRAE_2000326200 [Strongyloides ratti]CEF68606.1 Hypothetical protein SRAE_2000326200 [Strongyloides ratti]
MDYAQKSTKLSISKTVKNLKIFSTFKIVKIILYLIFLLQIEFPHIFKFFIIIILYKLLNNNYIKII